MENAAINSYRTRETLVKIVRKVSNPLMTTWYMDKVSVNPGIRFDSEPDAWDGIRHVENIVYLRNQSGGFSAWNRSATKRECEVVEAEKDRLWKMYKAYSDLWLRML